jgi:hypothetical protein
VDLREIGKAVNLIELKEDDLELLFFYITGVQNLGSVSEKLYS